MFQTLFLKRVLFFPFWPKIVQNWPIWLDVCNSLFKGWESLKKLKVGVFETDFKQVPFVLRQKTHTYSESWGQLENFFDGGGGEKMTQKPKFVSKIFSKSILTNFR